MRTAYPVEIFQTEDDQIRLEVQLSDETVWLSQAQRVALFARDQSVISRHVRNIFKEGELVKESNMQKMHIAGSDNPLTFFATWRRLTALIDSTSSELLERFSMTGSCYET